MNKTRAKGGLIIDDLKVGDVIHEGNYREVIKSTVITTPQQNCKGQWEWETETGEKIYYLITPGFTHYGPELHAEDEHIKLYEGL